MIEVDEPELTVEDLPGVGPATAEKLREAGFEELLAIAVMSPSELAEQAENIYINTNEHYRAKVETQTREDRFISWCKNKFPKKNYEKSNFILQGLRGIKDPEEITLEEAVKLITEKAAKGKKRGKKK